MEGRFPWHDYTKKCRQKILHPHNGGCFTVEDAKERGMHLAIGTKGSFAEGNYLIFYWLVDPDEGTIVDCKYQHFGDAIAISIAEAAVELLVGKNYDQALHINGELIDRILRDKKEQPACTASSRMHLNRVVEAIESAASECKGLSLPSSYTTPFSEKGDGHHTIYPGWEVLTKEEKMRVIEEFFSEEIRPYIELDEGGVKILDLKNERDLHIAYEGACTSCYSSIGTTLSSIQEMLRGKIHPDLTVIPNMDELQFHAS